MSSKAKTQAAQSGWPGSILATVAFALKASRPGFWLTAGWFYLLPLSGTDHWTTSAFWLGLVFVMFPFGLFIYGWNDFMDGEVDRLNPRKGGYLFGPKSTDRELRRLPWMILAVHLPLLCLLVVYVSQYFFWWYLTLALATAAYNWPRYGFKNWPFLDVLNQAGYLLVFQFSSSINYAPSLPWSSMLFGVMFAMHSHLLGQIMDLEPDRIAGRHSTAVVLGRVATKYLIAAFLAGECALVWLMRIDPVIGMFLALGAFWFIADALFLFRGSPYPSWMMRSFLLGWNAVAVISAPWVWARGTFVGPPLGP